MQYSLGSLFASISGQHIGLVFKAHLSLTAWPLKIGLVYFPEILVTNYQPTLLKTSVVPNFKLVPQHLLGGADESKMVCSL